MHWVRIAAILVGLFVVLWGAADITSRVANAALGKDALFGSFAPAAALDVPTAHGDTAVATTSATSTGPITPAVLKIPAIGVNANIEQVGKKADGSMGTPSNFTDVAWYELGGQPGGQGNVVIDGHVDNALTKSGVFENLSQLQKGDYITVEDSSGHAVAYKVSTVQSFDASTTPSDSIFASRGPSQLILITCQGDWVPSQKSFNERLVVTAEPAY